MFSESIGLRHWIGVFTLTLPSPWKGEEFIVPSKLSILWQTQFSWGSAQSVDAFELPLDRHQAHFPEIAEGFFDLALGAKFELRLAGR